MSNSNPDLTKPTDQEAPIVAILMSSPDDMTNDELTEHIALMRSLRTNQQTRKAHTSKPKKKSAINLDDLLS